MAPKKVYEKWNEEETKKIIDYCQQFKDILIKLEKENKKSIKKKFKPTHFFVNMSKYIGSKTAKQCKSKLQKLKKALYKKIGISQNFEDKNSKMLKQNENFEEETKLLNSNRTLATNSSTNFSYTPKLESLKSFDARFELSPLASQNSNSDKVTQEKQKNFQNQNKVCFKNIIQSDSEDEHQELLNNSVMCLSLIKEQII